MNSDPVTDVDIPGWQRSSFCDDGGVVRPYYWCGSGPPVLLLHELLGLSPADLSFGARLAEQGFTVYMPVLFGVPNAVNSARVIFRACVSREFDVMAERRSSPITNAARVLGRLMFATHGGKGIGVVGLCLTGNFALAMMADEHVIAPVLCEPALPFPLPWKRSALHASDEEIDCAKRRAADGVRFLGFRFRNDFMSPEQRFDNLGKALDGAFERHDLEPPHLFAHPVFTVGYDDKSGEISRAFERLVEFLSERLGRR
jgi:dienelactone hydrolase